MPDGHDPAEEERVAAGESQHGQGEPGIDVAGTSGSEERAGLVDVEVPEGDREALPLEGIEHLAVAAGPASPVRRLATNTRAAPAGAGDEAAEQHRAGVGGVDVVDDDQRGRSGGEPRSWSVMAVNRLNRSGSTPGMPSRRRAGQRRRRRRAGQHHLPRPQRRSPAVGPARTPGAHHSRVGGPVEDLLAEAGLADAGSPTTTIGVAAVRRESLPAGRQFR